MSNFIYQTPDNLYNIQKLENPIFGLDVSEYVIAKYDPEMFQWDGFYVFRPEDKLKDCFEWLVKHGKISQEEMNNQEHLWKPLTN
jgi:hypothetical protein